MKRLRIKPFLKISIKLLVTTLLLWLVFGKINLRDLGEMLLHASPFYLMLSLFVYSSSYMLSAIRSGLYLSQIGIRLNMAQGLQLYLLGVTANVALPGGIGGDGYKTYRLVKSHQASATQIVKAFFFERLSGLWAIGAWLAVLSVFTPSLPMRSELIFSLFITATIIYGIAIKKLFSGNTVILLRAHFLSLCIQALVSISVLCILESQTRPYHTASYLFSFHCSTILSILNIGLSGLGVREFVMSYAADWLQNNASLSVFTASAFWVVSTLSAIPGLAILLKDGMMIKKQQMDD